jgi:tetratricopeptide (TPR) repeat protein
MLRTHSNKFLSLLGVICMASLMPGSSGGQERGSEVQEHFLTAQQDQQNGLLDAAAHEYLAVLHLQPGLPEAYLNLGLVYYAQAKFEDSARALATAGKLKPGMRGVSLWLGIDNVKLHMPAQGAVLLREAIRQDPTDKLAQSWLATALWDAGQIDAALLQLGGACAQFPDDPDLLFARGEAYGKAATRQTEQLLEESSGTALSDLIYGTHYAEERDWTKAEGHFRRAIERDPRLLDARLGLAQTLLEQGRLPAAQEQLEQAIVLAPRSASALAHSGELLLLMRQRAEGLSRIERGMEIDPSETLDALGLPTEDLFSKGDRSGIDSTLLALCRGAAETLEADLTSSPVNDIALAALYLLAGDDAATQRSYQRMNRARVSPSPSASLVTQATTAMHQHRYEVAEPLLLRWLVTNPGDRAAIYDLIQVRRHISMAQIIHLLTVAPDSYHVHQLLGQLYVSREEDDEALAEYLAVASVRPDLPGIHFWLGHLYWKHGDADHAFAELTLELKLSPGHPEANAELGTVLVAEERAGEAIPHLESAIHSKQDLWPAYAQLGRAYGIEKKYARAEQVLEHALAHDQDGALHYQLALLLRAEGKTAQANQVFAQVRAIKSERMAAPATDDPANHETAGSGAKR